MRTEVVMVIVGMTVVTFRARFLGIAAFRNMEFSDRVIRWLRYIPIAILTVLITPTILTAARQIRMFRLKQKI